MEFEGTEGTDESSIDSSEEIQESETQISDDSDQESDNLDDKLPIESERKPKPDEKPQKSDGLKEGESKPTGEIDADGEKLFEIKVDGKIYKINEKQKLLYAQKGFAADKRFMEASQGLKNVQSLLHNIKSNPMEALQHPLIGLSKKELKEMAEQLVWEDVQKEQMTEEQRENYELKQKLENIEKVQREQERVQLERQNQIKIDQYREQYKKDISEVIEKDGQLPNNAYIIGRVAHWLQQGLDQGLDWRVEDVLDSVKQEWQDNVKYIVKSVPPERLINFFGEDIAKAIREQDLKRIKNPMGKKETVKSDDIPATKQKKALTWDEINALAERRAENE